MLRFEWDPDKAKANLKKHDVSFEVAKDVFLDPNALGPELDDPSPPLFEERWRLIGLASGKVLFVVYTERAPDVFRIISARKADRREEKAYFDQATT